MSGEVFEQARKGHIEGGIFEVGAADGIDSGSGTAAMRVSVIPKTQSGASSTEKV